MLSKIVRKFIFVMLTAALAFLLAAAEARAQCPAAGSQGTSGVTTSPAQPTTTSTGTSAQSTALRSQARGGSFTVLRQRQLAALQQQQQQQAILLAIIQQQQLNAYLTALAQQNSSIAQRQSTQNPNNR